MLRYLALMLLVVLLALEIKLWTGLGGMREVWQLQEQVTEQRQKNIELKQRNESLSAEVEDLKKGREAIEERARSELGLLKPGETFIEVVEPADGSKSSGSPNGR